MSSIPSISSALAAFAQGGTTAETQDWKALQADLQKGDLSSALGAFSAMQNDMPNPPSTGKPPSADSLIGEALRALQTALQKIDLSGAQSAFSDLQAAVKTAYAQASSPAAATAIAPEAADAIAVSVPTTPPQPPAGSTLNLRA